MIVLFGLTLFDTVTLIDFICGGFVFWRQGPHQKQCYTKQYFPTCQHFLKSVIDEVKAGKMVLVPLAIIPVC